MSSEVWTPPSRADAVTRERHRREVAWQIYLPLGLGLVCLAATALAAGAAQTGATSVWADVSLVFLLALAMLVGVLGLAAAIAGAVGVAWLVRALPEQAGRLHQGLARVPAAVHRGAEASVAPVLALRATLSALRAGARSLRAILRSD